MGSENTKTRRGSTPGLIRLPALQDVVQDVCNTPKERVEDGVRVLQAHLFHGRDNTKYCNPLTRQDVHVCGGAYAAGSLQRRNPALVGIRASLPTMHVSVLERQEYRGCKITVSSIFSRFQRSPARAI